MERLIDSKEAGGRKKEVDSVYRTRALPISRFELHDGLDTLVVRGVKGLLHCPCFLIQL